MRDFFNLKNVTTMAGVVLAFVLPHIFFEDDHYIEIIEPVDEDVEVETESTITESAEEQ